MIVALGFVAAAALGASARFVLGRTLSTPVGTLVANATGSFVLGTLHGLDAPAATVAGVALLGSFTTLSSFARELLELVEDARPMVALGYATLTVVGGLGAAAVGLATA